MSDTLEIDFGRVSNYVDDRGFGFVSQSIQDQIGSDIFFHIKTIKRSHPDIAKILDDGGYQPESECENNKNSPDAICFWYRVEKTKKGLQVKSVIHISDLSDDEVSRLRRKIEKIWQEKKYISNCLIHATEDVLGVDRTNELKNIQNDRKIKEIRKNLKRLKEEVALRKEGSEPKILIDDHILQLEIDSETQRLRELDGTERIYLELIENEYKQIIEEIKPLGFTHSKEVSYYIIENNLGEKYKNISGVVRMEKDGNTWDFEGGFPPNIYKRICRDLGLVNEYSSAKAVDFESYNDLHKK